MAGSGISGSDLNQLDRPTGLALHGNAIYVAERGNRRIVRWPLGAVSGTIVAGSGAAINGINDLGDLNGDTVVGTIAITTGVKILVVDCDNSRLLQFGDGRGEVVGEGLWQLDNPQAVAVNGDAIYVLDAQGTRVQKLENGIVAVAARMYQFPVNAINMHVAASGVMYFCEPEENRVRRWEPGVNSVMTVAGGNGAGSMLHQLDLPISCFVSSSEDIYVSDTNNNRIMKWQRGATTGVVVAGGCGLGSEPHQLRCPTGAVCDDAGALYVCSAASHLSSSGGRHLALH